MRTVFNIARYPSKQAISTGEQVVIRPLEVGDEFDLREFFLSLSADERAFLRDDVTDPNVTERWARHTDFARALPLVAIEGNRIVADAVLLRGEALSHTAEIRMTLARRLRHTDLPDMLLADLASIAEEADMDSVTLFITPADDSALLASARRVGFRDVGMASADAKPSASVMEMTFSHLHEKPETRPSFDIA